MKENENSAITSFALFFTKRWRVAILLLLSTVFLGVFTYTNVLKRETMPPIDIPIGIVTTPYFINDTDGVNEQITKPLEDVISQIPEVVSISSTTESNFSNLVVEFDVDLKSAEGMDLVESTVKESNILPEGADPIYTVFDAGKIDGEHDLLFTITADDPNTPITQIQQKAREIASKLEESPEILEANSLDVITNEINPITGEMVESQTRFSRFGKKDSEGNLEFSKAIYIGLKQKDPDFGTIEFSDEVRNEINKLSENGLLDGYEATFSVGDYSILLKDQIDSLETNALQAFFIVFLILFFFVSWRGSIVTAIFIPVVLAATFLGLYLIGYSINTMTLFALVLVLGLFVDDAIVVVEAIDAEKQKGKKGFEAVRMAIQRIGVADISGTVTTILVFVPMAMVTGVLGEFIVFLPITVIIALIASIIMALSVIPFLSNLVINDKSDEKETKLGQIIDTVTNGPGRIVYQIGVLVSKFVYAYLSKPLYAGIVFVVSIALIMIGGYFAGQVPFNIFPPAKDTDAIEVNIVFPEGTTLETAEDIAKEVEQDLKNLYPEEVEYVNYFQADNSTVSIYVELTDIGSRESSKKIVEELNNTYGKYETARVKAKQSDIGAPEEEYPFKVQIFADDQETLEAASAKVKEYLTNLEVSDETKVEDVIVTNLLNISKVDGQRYSQIAAKITESDNKSGDLQTLTNKVKEHYTPERLEEIGLSEDSIGYDLGFETELVGSVNSILLGMAVAFIIMYALLVIQFNSFTQPLLVFMGVPFSFPLLFPGLLYSNNYFSFFVLLGIMGLMGIVVNNTIMLLDYAKSRKLAKGKGPKDAIAGALKKRFRPLVTTTTTTVAGLLPLALTDPFWEPFALSIIFGLISSTTLVILVFPVYYYIVELMRKQIHKLPEFFGSVLKIAQG